MYVYDIMSAMFAFDISMMAIIVCVSFIIKGVRTALAQSTEWLEVWLEVMEC